MTTSSDAEKIVRALETIDEAVARADAYAGVDDVDAQFDRVKSVFIRRALVEHPDKGGDASAFARLYESCVRCATRVVRSVADGVVARFSRFQLVREAARGGASISAAIRDATSDGTRKKKTRGKKTATTTAKGKKTKTKKKAVKALAPELMGDRETIPPYAFFAMMREMDVVGYKIELAASGRSRCQCAKNKADGVAYCRNVNVGSEMGTVEKTKGKKKKKASTGLEIEAADASFGLIADRAIRIAVLVPESGEFGLFRHLNCWRVPKSVWFCMPEPGFCRESEYTVQEYARRLSQMDDVIFSGWRDLSDADKNLVATHVMNVSMWASYNEKKYIAARDAGFPSITAAEKALLLPAPVKRESIESADAAKESLAVAVAEDDLDVDRHAQGAISATHLRGTIAKRAEKKKAAEPPDVLIPVPNVDGAIANSLTVCRAESETRTPLTFVLTGIFPELDRETFGLAQGKDKAKEFIERFGGVVRTALSGRTDMLLVGREPGVAKLSEARSRNVPLLNLEHLIDLVHGRSMIDKPIKIDSFSTGFYGTGLAVKMTADELNELRRSHGALPAPSKPEPAPLLPSSSNPEPSPLLPSSSEKITKTKPSSTTPKMPKALPSTATTSKANSSKKRAAASEETTTKRSKRLALAA